MTPFEELATSREYWLAKTQNELYDCVEKFRENKKWTRTQLAEHLGVTKGYVSQILNGDFDHKLSKLIDLSLAVGVAPKLHFQGLETYIEDYISGYDGCLRSDKVEVKMHVVHKSASHIDAGYSSRYSENESEYLIDNEVFVSYASSLATTLPSEYA